MTEVLFRFFRHLLRGRKAESLSFYLDKIGTYTRPLRSNKRTWAPPLVGHLPSFRVGSLEHGSFKLLQGQPCLAPTI